METFMAIRIEEACDISLEKGQSKYKAYFKNKRYKKYQDDVDTILRTDGYERVIVE